mmetsp:Transcript_4626/g.10189  ORF Transcript_4626/g.10189 Transcript_4626/m.10189 type:complete len:485 (+) Transcript_4626:30-1484(+)
MERSRSTGTLSAMPRRVVHSAQRPVLAQPRQQVRSRPGTPTPPTRTTYATPLQQSRPASPPPTPGRFRAVPLAAPASQMVARQASPARVASPVVRAAAIRQTSPIRQVAMWTQSPLLRAAGPSNGAYRTEPAWRRGSVMVVRQRTEEAPDVSCEPFVADPSCLGERYTHLGLNGFLESSPGVLTKLGSSSFAMVLSMKGFTSGCSYWEFVDAVEDDRSEEMVGFRVGVVPRSANIALDVDCDILDNVGYGAWFLHSSQADHVPGKVVGSGDRIGLMLDLTGAYGKLMLFVNGEFAGPTIDGIPKDRPLYPALSTVGRPDVVVALTAPTKFLAPSLRKHAAAEQAYLASLAQNASANSQVVSKAGLHIALAHVGSTVEMSSHTREKVTLRRGDAVLYVETVVQGSGGCLDWSFDIDDEAILAKDPYYTHRELDLGVAGENGHREGLTLKVAYKFVAVGSGVTWFRSAPVTGDRGWAQTVKIEVVE